MHTFVDPLYRARTLFADAVSMVSGEVRLTYADTWCRCRRLAGGLTRLGLEPGDRVAILAANSHRYLEVYLAVPASGREPAERGGLTVGNHARDLVHILGIASLDQSPSADEQLPAPFWGSGSSCR